MVTGVDITRRQALGGAAVIGAQYAIRVTGKPKPFTAHGRVRVGCNRGTWDQFTKAVPDADVVRVWYDTFNAIPADWPARALLPDGTPAPAVLSIRPWPPDLLAGKLDAAITGMISSAPHGSHLNTWHEAGGNNPLGYPAEVNDAATMRKVHRYMHALCQGSHARYGPITCGPAMNLLEWLPGGMDWYGTDEYDNPRYWNKNGTIDTARVLARHHNNLEAWRKVSGLKWPKWLIGESNSSLDRHRTAWFSLQAQFLSENGGHALCTAWFTRKGSLSGPWPHASASVRRGLAALAKAYQ